jgi:hypothetical protein
VATEVFNIEFKFPTGRAIEWNTFAAKAREAADGIWEIYSVQSYSEAAALFKTKRLIKSTINWKESESNRETLLAALIGRAIDKATNRLP